MTRKLTRRHLLGLSGSAVAAWGAAQLAPGQAIARDFTKPVPQATGLTVYLNGAQVLARWNNAPLLGYRAHPSLKYPYLAPLSGPITGLSLVTESALPYPHHRGAWLGCDPLNGGDYWTDGALERGRIGSLGLAIVAADDGGSDADAGSGGGSSAGAPLARAAFTDRCRWERQGGGAPFEDERRFTISVLDDRVRLIDCRFTLRALEPITIRSAKHSFFALRAAHDISPIYGGVLMNSEGGVGAAGTYGKEARWCGYHGRRQGRPDVVEGIAFLIHPDTPWRPIWFTRDYGHLSPSPFNFLDRPWSIEKGETIELRYAMALHAGDPKEAQLDTVYRRWIGSQT